MIRAVWTIARRDVVATLFSRGFLLWLAAPIFGLLIGLFGAAIGGATAPETPSVAVLQSGDAMHWIRQAEERLRPPEPGGLAELRAEAPFRLTFTTAEADLPAQARRLLEGDRYAAVLAIEADDLSRARLFVRKDSRDVGRPYLQSLLDSARLLSGSGGDVAPVGIVSLAIAAPEKDVDEHRSALGVAAAVVLFTLIGLLAGVLLSNMVEEKSNKIIEVLVASVPVPAIFAGKLLGMLLLSAIGIAVWAAIFGGIAAAALASLPAGAVPVPAVGWTAFLLLAAVYLATAYLIFGAIYLGIGSLCSSVREVQTLSLPVTVAQMVVIIGVLAAVDNPGGVWAALMSWFPLSSPYMMAARAALEPGLGVHAAAILWQLLFAGFVIWLSARLFRFGVLHSGAPPKLSQLWRQKSSLS